MAAPITHIVLAEKIFDRHFPGLNRKDFFVGTSFPDIRYMGIIEREKTHFNEIKIGDLMQKPAFETGMKFHSLVDIVRENYMHSRGIYPLLPGSPYTVLALKIYEDKVLYREEKKWKEMMSYFDAPTHDELLFGLKDADIMKWHEYLQKYFLTGPSEQNIRYFIGLINRPVQMADEILKIIKAIEERPETEIVVRDFYNQDFEKLIAL